MYYSILEGLYSGTWSMTFTWGDPFPPEIQPRPWPCFESIEPSEGTVLARLDTSIKVKMMTPVDRYVTEGDSNGNEYKAIVNLLPREFSLVDEDGNEIPWHLEWNSTTMKTAFYVVPDQFLAPNTTYNFTARARARGSLVLNGLYEDTISTSFTTGPLPPASEMVQETYPFDGQRYFYREHSINVKFKKEITRAFEGYQLAGELTSEDGTQVEGTLSMSEGNDLAIFDPATTLNPTTRYVFKLYKLPESGSESGQAGGTQGGSGGGTGGIIGGTEAEGLSPVGMRDLEIQPLLELQFETGQYGTFVEMVNASTLDLHFYRNPGDFTTYYLDIQNTAEPVYWKDILIDRNPETLYGNAAANEIGECVEGFVVEEYCRRTRGPVSPGGGTGPSDGGVMPETPTDQKGYKQDMPGGSGPALPDTDVDEGGQGSTAGGGTAGSTGGDELCYGIYEIGDGVTRHVTRDAEITLTLSPLPRRATSGNEIPVHVEFKDFRVDPRPYDCDCEIRYWSHQADPSNECVELLYDAILSRKGLAISLQHKEESEGGTVATSFPSYPNEMESSVTLLMATQPPGGGAGQPEQPGDEGGIDVDISRPDLPKGDETGPAEITP